MIGLVEEVGEMLENVFRRTPSTFAFKHFLITVSLKNMSVAARTVFSELSGIPEV